MTDKEFLREIESRFNSEESGSFIDRILSFDKKKHEMECVVYFGGYEPSRVRIWESDGKISYGIK